MITALSSIASQPVTIRMVRACNLCPCIMQGSVVQLGSRCGCMEFHRWRYAFQLPDVDHTFQNRSLRVFLSKPYLDRMFAFCFKAMLYQLFLEIDKSLIKTLAVTEVDRQSDKLLCVIGNEQFAGLILNQTSA